MAAESRPTATLKGGLWRNLVRYRRRVTGSDSWGWYLWQGLVLTLLVLQPQFTK